MTKKMLNCVVVACVAGAAFCASRAQAALIVNLNGVTSITDNAAGDSDPAVGRIINSSNVTGFGIAVSIAASNSPGTSTAGLLQISSLDIENQTGGTGVLTITVSDTNYTLPGAGIASMLLDSDIGGTFAQGSAVGNTVSFRSFADPANVQPAAAVSTPALIFLKATSSTTEAFSGSNTVPWTRGAGAYSLANQAVITLTAGGQVNISGTTTATLVPEPASLAAIGLAGTALAMGRRRRH